MYLLKPDSRGSITLRSPDPRVPPVIDHGFLSEPHDLERLSSGVALIRTVRVASESRWGAPGDQARLILRLFRREVELEMTLREFVPNQLVAYDSVQAGLPSAHRERHFRPVDGGFAYRIVVEYEPRTGPRGLPDRTVIRRGIDRAVGKTMLNLERVLTKS